MLMKKYFIPNVCKVAMLLPIIEGEITSN